MLEQLTGRRAETVPHCCSEAGTLALSDPTSRMRCSTASGRRVREALVGPPAGRGVADELPVLPAGARRNAALAAEPRHLAVELARQLSGDDWLELFRTRAGRAQVVHF